jgi:hypothetical protein
MPGGRFVMSRQIAHQCRDSPPPRPTFFDHVLFSELLVAADGDFREPEYRFSVTLTPVESVTHLDEGSVEPPRLPGAR